MRAPFVDAASTIDPTNFDNIHISYYTYGAAIALALDLAIRSNYEALSLDSLMQAMWVKYGKPERPYTNADIQATLAEVTGSELFARRFFERYIFGNALPDYSALLEHAGLRLVAANGDAAWVGPVTFEFDGKEAIIASNTIIGTPLYEAGLDRGDRVIAIDRLKITSGGRWDDALSRYVPGDTATITYVQRGIERTAQVLFEEDPTVEIVTYESSDLETSREQQGFRKAWLGQ
jgi:predicted metalloprotease with PDZ domain